jgi:hypothetical protein
MLTEKDLERFWKYVEKTDNCWNWTASLNTYGYGCFWWNRKQHQSHRVSWYIQYGMFPKDCLLHICDNPKCVNPSHLKEGTQIDNIHDKKNKRRQAYGERMGGSKLKESQVIEIMEKHSLGESIANLSREYKVSDTAIKYILIGRNWSYLHKGKM